MSLLDKELKRKYKKPKGYKKDARRVKGKTSKQKMPDFIRNLGARERPLFRFS